MKRTFIETIDFQKQVERLNSDGNLLFDIQNTIIKIPNIGVLIQGTGGLRKLRMGLKGKGKSGGIRIFYLDLPNKEKCYLLFILEKSESGNISAEEKNELYQLAQFLKR